MNKKGIIGIAIIGIIVVGGLSSTKDKDKEKIEVKDTNPTVSQKVEVKKEEPKFDFSSTELNNENILKAIGDKEKYNVTIEEDKNEGTIVSVFYSLTGKSFWNDEGMLNNNSDKFLELAPILFSNPKVDKIWVWSTAELTDKYGKTKEENVINIGMSRKTFDKADLKNSMFKANYKSVHEIADGEFIHPALKK